MARNYLFLILLIGVQAFFPGMENSPSSLQASRELVCDEDGFAVMNLEIDKTFAMLHKNVDHRVLLGEHSYLSFIVRPLDSKEKFTLSLMRGTKKEPAARIKNANSTVWFVTDICRDPIFGGYGWRLEVECSMKNPMKDPMKFDVSFSYESAHADELSQIIIPPQSSVKLLLTLISPNSATAHVNISLTEAWPAPELIKLHVEGDGGCGEGKQDWGNISPTPALTKTVSLNGSVTPWFFTIRNEHTSTRQLLKFSTSVRYDVSRSGDKSGDKSGDSGDVSEWTHFDLFKILDAGDEHAKKKNFYTAKKLYKIGAERGGRHPAPFLRMLKLFKNFNLHAEEDWNSWLDPASVFLMEHVQKSGEIAGRSGGDSRWSILSGLVEKARRKLMDEKHKLAETLIKIYNNETSAETRGKTQVEIAEICGDISADSEGAPFQNSATYAAAQFLKRVGRNEEAAKEMGRLLERGGGENCDILLPYAEILEHSKKFSAAIDAVSRCILAPKNSKNNLKKIFAHVTLARLILHPENRDGKTAEDWRRVIENIETYIRLERDIRRDIRREEGGEEGGEGEGERVENLHHLELLAQAHLLLGDDQMALSYFTKAAHLSSPPSLPSPPIPFAAAGVASIILRQGNFAEEEKLFKKISNAVSETLRLDQGHTIPPYVSPADASRYLDADSLAGFLSKKYLKIMRVGERLNFDFPTKISVGILIATPGTLAERTFHSLLERGSATHLRIFDVSEKSETSSEISTEINGAGVHVIIVVDAGMSESSMKLLALQPAPTQIIHSGAGWPLHSSPFPSLFHFSDRIISPPELAVGGGPNIILPSLFSIENSLIPAARTAARRKSGGVVATLENICDLNFKNKNIFSKTMKKLGKGWFLTFLLPPSFCKPAKNIPQNFIQATVDSARLSEMPPMIISADSFSPPSKFYADIVEIGVPILTQPKISTTSRVAASLSLSLSRTGSVSVVNSIGEFHRVAKALLNPNIKPQFTNNKTQTPEKFDKIFSAALRLVLDTNFHRGNVTKTFSFIIAEQ